MAEFDKPQLLKKLASGEIKEVLNALFSAEGQELIATKGLTEDLVLISNSWNSLKRKIQKGIISQEDSRIEQNQVVDQLTGLIKSVYDETPATALPPADGPSIIPTDLKEKLRPLLGVIGKGVVPLILFGLFFLLWIRPKGIPKIKKLHYQVLIQDQNNKWQNILQEDTAYVENGKPFRLLINFGLNKTPKKAIIEYKILTRGNLLDQEKKEVVNDFQRLSINDLNGQHTFYGLQDEVSQVSITYRLANQGSTIKFIENTLNLDPWEQGEAQQSIVIVRVPTVTRMNFVRGGTYSLQEPGCQDFSTEVVSVSSILVDQDEVSYQDFQDYLKEPRAKCSMPFHPKLYFQTDAPDNVLPALASWENAKCYCEGQKKRLPTLQEWVYIKMYPMDQDAQFETDACPTWSLGKLESFDDFIPNSSGIRCLDCNALEWTASLSSDQKEAFVVGGGSFILASDVPCFYQKIPLEEHITLNTYYPIGFRCVKDIQ